MNKYTLRRFIASIITAPLAIVAYGLLWFILLAAGAHDNGAFYDNLWFIAIVWVLAWTFTTDVLNYLERKGINV